MFEIKELDVVEVIAEKTEYAIDGVHKGMQGWICDERVIDGYRLVNSPQCGANADIATTEIKEDLKIIPKLDARKNEENNTEKEGEQGGKTGANQNNYFRSNCILVLKS